MVLTGGNLISVFFASRSFFPEKLPGKAFMMQLLDRFTAALKRRQY
jgi:hypothetical protein